MTSPSRDPVQEARDDDVVIAFHLAATDAVMGCLTLREADALDRTQQVMMADALNECIQRMRQAHAALADVLAVLRAELSEGRTK